MLLRHANREVTVGVVAPLEFLAMVSVVLRIFTRLRISKIKLKADDYMVLVAVMTQSSLAITTLIEFRSGIGLHRSTLENEPDKLVVIKIVQYCATWIFVTNIMLVKISILLLYRRIFTISRLRLACNWLLGIIVAYTAVIAFLAIFLCSPVNFYWNQIYEGREGRCLDRRNVLFAFSALDMFTNIAIVLVPMRGLMGLSMARRKRYSLVALFAVSLMPCIAAAIRSSIVRFVDLYDFSYFILDMCLWSVVEMTVGCICANIPTLTPLLLHFFPRLFNEDDPSNQIPVLRRLSSSGASGGGGGPFEGVGGFCCGGGGGMTGEGLGMAAGRFEGGCGGGLGKWGKDIESGCSGSEELEDFGGKVERIGSGVDSLRDVEKGVIAGEEVLVDEMCCEESGERA
ncbi:hypothetical protein K490DRAFT_68015 [Saccharata proteae CBS 121410]|uniref:Rhodopsin domain-containing protein n=1 Tax=Saccharata proteae CBS 121410 TaxID=1314787 RepID=A0A9P4HSD6_9PEZI|nr:hypothetical protein K490DRAFT_68015 [Saccharata proteae CBS 121410]